MNKRPDILTLSEVAEYLRTSVKTVRRRIASGKLMSIKEGGRRVVLAGDLDAYIQGHKERRGTR